jgi:hypothetical protein
MIVNSVLQGTWSLAPAAEDSGWAWRDSANERKPFMCTAPATWVMVYSNVTDKRMTLSRPSGTVVRGVVHVCARRRRVCMNGCVVAVCYTCRAYPP